MQVEAKRKLLEKTKRELDESVIVIEGKRDERALRETGFAPNARIVKAGGRTADATARRAIEVQENENNEKTKIVVLTDFDEEGERRAAEIREALLALGVSPNAALRRNFVRLLGARCVENAPTALARLEDALENAKTRRTTKKQ